MAAEVQWNCLPVGLSLYFLKLSIRIKFVEKLTYENIVFRYLAENLNPDFHTIALFRKENRQLIKQSFLQTIEIAKKLNMVNFNKLYLDGIKVKANASKSKSFTKEEIDFLSDFVDKHLKEMGS